MRFLKYLQEEYMGMIKTYQGAYTIYKNPTSADIKGCRKEGKEIYNDAGGFIRGLVDLTKKDFYIFPAYADVHQPAYERMVKAKIISTSRTKLLTFIGYIDNNKIYGQELGPFTGEQMLPDISSLEWLKSYISNMDEYRVDAYRTGGRFNLKR